VSAPPWLDGGDASGETWWRSGVLYEIYPRSFADSDSDGVGDLRGVIERLDHLSWLGVDGIWLNPTTPSPNADWGYDVTEYMSVDPELGDLETLDRLIAEAGERGIRVLLDLVPNHTSDRHPWFVESRSSRDSPRRDWFVWADGRGDGSPPNNWRSNFGGPAWTRDEGSGQYYLHNFLPEQPDLNWWNEEVRQAFDDILRFWFDRGVAGFRIDVANGVIKDRDLRDNPPVTEDDHPLIQLLGLRPVHNMNRPEVHDIHRRWRRIADAHDPPAILVGETWIPDLTSYLRYYGNGTDELHLAMNFLFLFSELGPQMREVVEASEASIPREAWPVWTGSNHDVGRLATRWCGGDERKVRTALLLLLTLRGTPILYEGDEIGMPDVEIPKERLLDPVGVRGWPENPGRDRCRTPMQWSGQPGGGFARPGVEPWLPMGDAAACNVADQREDPGSVLHLVHDLIRLRRRRPDLRAGAYAGIEAPAGAWAWRRGAQTVVALNLSEAPLEVRAGPGEVLVGTRRERDGELVGGSIPLDPWEAVVVSERATS
jgi:alpha-glucosidase